LGSPLLNSYTAGAKVVKTAAPAQQVTAPVSEAEESLPMDQLRVRIRDNFAIAANSGVLEEALTAMIGVEEETTQASMEETKVLVREKLVESEIAKQAQGAEELKAEIRQKFIESEVVATAEPSQARGIPAEVKERLRQTLETAASSGCLEKALLTAMTPSAEKKPQTDSVNESSQNQDLKAKLKERLRQTLETAASSGCLENALLTAMTPSAEKKPQMETVNELKFRLAETLTESCESGALSSALSVLYKKEDVNVQQLKLRLRGALQTSCSSGSLARALTEVIPPPTDQTEAGQSSDSVNELKLRLKATLQESCQSGGLSSALNEVFSTQASESQQSPEREDRQPTRWKAGQSSDSVTELKLRLKATLQESCQSGGLSSALNEVFATQASESQQSPEREEIEMLKARVRSILTSSCVDGRLEQFMGDSEPVDPDSAVGNMKVGVRDALFEASASGRLASALSSAKIQKSKEDIRSALTTKFESGSLEDALREAKAEFTSSSSSSASPASAELEDLRTLLRTNLSESQYNGELARVLGDLFPEAAGAAEAPVAPEAAADSRDSDIPQLKARLRQSLQTAWTSGNLERTLRSCVEGNDPAVSSMKNRLRDAMEAACESGDLECILNGSMPPVADEVAPLEASPAALAEESRTPIDEAKLRERLRQTLETAASSGCLENALLTAMTPSAEKKPQTDSVNESSASSVCLENALLDGAKSRLMSALQGKFESGEFAAAFEDVLARPAQEVAASEVDRAKWRRDNSPKRTETVKSQIRSVLQEGDASGRLAAALQTVYVEPSAAPDHVEERKQKVRAMLREGFESGQLAEALEEVMPPSHKTAPPEADSAMLKRAMLATLEKGFSTGDLERILDQEKEPLAGAVVEKEPAVVVAEAVAPSEPAETPAELQRRLSQALLSACSNGELERILGNVLPSAPAETPAVFKNLSACSNGELDRILGNIVAAAPPPTQEAAPPAPVEAPPALPDEPTEAELEPEQDKTLDLSLDSSPEVGTPEQLSEDSHLQAAGSLNTTCASPLAPKATLKIDQSPVKEPIQEELADIRSNVSHIAQENVSLKEQLQRMCAEMAEVRQQNANLADKINNHAHDIHGSHHGH